MAATTVGRGGSLGASASGPGVGGVIFALPSVPGGGRGPRSTPMPLRVRPTARDTLEEFLKLWHDLRAESGEPGTVVVVEGERDRRSLRRLGIDGRIVALHRGRPLSGTAHDLVDRAARVIVLTDWDTEGGHFARRLKEFLEADRPSLDLEYRRRLARIVRGELVHVEGLYGWARRLAEVCGDSIEERLDRFPGP
jgi:5S rRNA maturation endonuclease (ribonuclease M5)